MAANRYSLALILLVVASTLSSCSFFEDDKIAAQRPKQESWTIAYNEGYKARRNKDWPGAQEKYLQALKAARQAHAESKYIAEILTELGGVYAKQTKWEQSEEMLSQSQDIYEKLWDPDRGGVANRDYAINLAKVMFSRSTVLLNDNQNQKALRTIRRAHEIADAAPAPDHLTGEIMSLEATILEKVGKTEESVRIREGASVLETTMDERSIASNKTNWQKLLDEADRAIGSLDYDYAEKAYNKALEQLNDMRPDGVGKARALTGLAIVYDARKNYPRAELFLQRSISMLSKGMQNPVKKELAVDTVHRLATVQLHASRLAEAEKTIYHALALEKQRNDHDGFKRKERRLIDALIEILEAEKKYDEAEKIVKDKLKLELKLYGARSSKIGLNYGKLARLSALDGRTEEANGYYEKSISYFDGQKGWNPRDKINVIEEYLKHLRETGSDKKREAELTKRLENEQGQIKTLFPF